MAFSPSRWCNTAALAVLAMLPVALGCKGKSHASTTPTITVSGHVTYTRLSLLKDSKTGIPTGLDVAHPATDQPARGIVVQALQEKLETDASGKQVSVWIVPSVTGNGHTTTDANGYYSITVPQGPRTFVEVVSYSDMSGTVRVIADDVDSSVPISDRLLYSVRKGLDGSAPAGNPVPGTDADATSTVDFAVGLTDRWWISDLQTPLTPELIAEKESNGTLYQESAGTGSRVVAILDSIYSFENLWVNPDVLPITPNYKGVMDFHYKSGVSNARGSFVEYNTSAYPLSWDGNAYHYFGSVRGGPDNDDAWDEGVIFPLLGRNYVYSLLSQLVDTSTMLYPIDAHLPGDSQFLKDRQDLSPELALVEGLGDAMAANILKSPYLADTNGSSVVSVRDIRDLTGLVPDAHSAATMAALGWDITMTANSISSPKSASSWTSIDPSILIKRLFTMRAASGTSGTVGYYADLPSIYVQIATLQMAGTSGVNSVTPSSIFTDDVLTGLLAPYNIPWPRPTSGAESHYIEDWGQDINTLNSSSSLPPVTLSMADAHLDRTGLYPNVSKGEVVRAKFLLNSVTTYDFSLVPASGTPSTLTPAHVQVILNGTTYSFFGTDVLGKPDPTSYRITLSGTNAMQIRLISPSTLQPDLTYTVRLDKVS